MFFLENVDVGVFISMVFFFLNGCFYINLPRWGFLALGCSWCFSGNCSERVLVCVCVCFFFSPSTGFVYLSWGDVAFLLTGVFLISFLL